ncbi:MAG: DUF167 domain-containing protein [Armatimonadetes bacterium]|nr:DUF167 domain-containing protein [Armatimonadota bacterium]
MNRAKLLALVAPRSSTSKLAGFRRGRLVIRVCAPPDKGKANEESRDLIAGFLGIPKSRVSLLSGGASREKTFLIEGVTQEAMDTRLAASFVEIDH